MVAVVVVGFVLFTGGDEAYTVTARFESASQLVKGNEVQVAGKAIGEVSEIKLAPDNGADVKLKITDPDYAPLRRGTEAIIRLTSLSGVANRYVDLRLPGGNTPSVPKNGVLPTQDTTSAVDLDALLNALDKRARTDLQGVVQGLGKQYDGNMREAQRGWLYLNPSLAATSRLFEELNRDTPALNKFVDSSAELVTDVAAREDDLSGLVDEAATTFTAIAGRREELSDALGQLPPFMRRANSTFVNLRAAIDDLRPLVRETKPVTPKLRRLLAELRPLARDARPTLRDLATLVSRPGVNNDLIELTKSNVPLRDAALRESDVNGAKRRGAFPESIDALKGLTPIFSYYRPYTVDLTGWFDDFGHSGLYDALGGKSRVGTYVNAFGQIDGVLRPIPVPLRDEAASGSTVRNQRNRCPGAAERVAPDKSNPWKPTEDFNCDPSQVLPGS